jgi:iron complex transport system permease protein
MQRQSDIDEAFGRSVRHRRVTIVFTALAVLLVVFASLNLVIGTVDVDLWDIIVRHNESNPNYAIVWNLRVPRLIAAALLGGALALSGFLLQTFFNNPIAGPFILGISSGAKLVVAIVMILVVGSTGVMTNAMLIISAFVGSLIAMLFVLLVSRRINSMSMLIVAGVMIGYICTAITDFLITFASDANIVNLKNWSLGSFSGTNWSDIGIMTAVVVVSAAAVFCLSKPIGAFQLGEQYARSMGVNIRFFRIALILLSSLLAATVTAFAGPISFVGIAVPHVIKRALGTSKPLVVIPGAFFGGAIFCLFCDLIARTAFAPTEVSISAVTALFGAPIVISILLRREKSKR